MNAERINPQSAISNRTMKLLKTFTLPSIALGLALFALYHLIYAEERLPALPPPSTPPSTSLANTIAAVGVAEPTTENISVGAAQSGVVLEVMYTSEHVGHRVQKGEPLFRVDDRSWQAQRKVNLANLKASQAELSKLELRPRPEDLPPLEAAVQVAQAKVSDSDDRFQRVQQLTGDAIARDERQQRRFAFEIAKHELEQAKTELDREKAGAWKPDIEIAEAAVEVAKANLSLTDTEIERCTVRSPIEGELLKVNIRVGEYVTNTAAAELMVLGDIERMNLRVDIDEEDIPRFRAGLTAWAVPRGKADRKMKLRFVRVEPLVVPKKMLSGAGDERVDTRVIQAIYQFESKEDSVYVGQLLDVFIDLKSP